MMDTTHFCIVFEIVFDSLVCCIARETSNSKFLCCYCVECSLIQQILINKIRIQFFYICVAKECQSEKACNRRNSFF